MVTLDTFNNKSITGVLGIKGLSTDDKPIESFQGYKIMNGSHYFEIDTGYRYMYSQSDDTWHKVGGGGGPSPEYDYVTEEDIDELDWS